MATDAPGFAAPRCLAGGLRVHSSSPTGDAILPSESTQSGPDWQRASVDVASTVNLTTRSALA